MEPADPAESSAGSAGSFAGSSAGPVRSCEPSGTSGFAGSSIWPVCPCSPSTSDCPGSSDASSPPSSRLPTSAKVSSSAFAQVPRPAASASAYAIRTGIASIADKTTDKIRTTPCDPRPRTNITLLLRPYRPNKTTPLRAYTLLRETNPQGPYGKRSRKDSTIIKNRKAPRT